MNCECEFVSYDTHFYVRDCSAKLIRYEKSDEKSDEKITRKADYHSKNSGRDKNTVAPGKRERKKERNGKERQLRPMARAEILNLRLHRSNVGGESGGDGIKSARSASQ